MLQEAFNPDIYGWSVVRRLAWFYPTSATIQPTESSLILHAMFGFAFLPFQGTHVCESKLHLTPPSVNNLSPLYEPVELKHLEQT